LHATPRHCANIHQHQLLAALCELRKIAVEVARVAVAVRAEPERFQASCAAFLEEQRGACDALRGAGGALEQRAQPMSAVEFQNGVNTCRAIEVELARRL
jgi:hypothetical protein